MSPLLRAAKLGRQARHLMRRQPDAWDLGEQLAEDRFETIQGELWPWTDSAAVDEYVSRASQDVIHLAHAASMRDGRVLPTEFLSAMGIACGLHLEPALQKYVACGQAAADQLLLKEHMTEFESAAEMAETYFNDDRTSWMRSIPVVGWAIDNQIDDMGLGAKLYLPYETPVFARSFRAKMAELVRETAKASYPL